MENQFEKYFGRKPEFFVTAPGRTELCGNHTDHEHGKVLAGPVNLLMKAAVAPNESTIVRIFSEGYGSEETDISDLSPHEEEYGKTKALVRGVASAFSEYGLKGFDAYVTSDIPAGSGLSSSAAMEILLGRIFCKMTGAQKSGTELAIIGQKAENVFFGKPCGLMDQMACASTGIIAIDFVDPQNPLSREIRFRFSDAGYLLCIINCGAGHEDLTNEYASITQELQKVCEVFGKKVLREVDEETFYDRISEVRQAAGDRAVLRALHVFEENRRVEAQIHALEQMNMDEYLRLVKESGRSSWELLQNVIPQGADKHQELAFALAIAEKALAGKGAVRVHGGGFAGTLQAFVPVDQKESFRAYVERFLGENSCIFANIGVEGE